MSDSRARVWFALFVLAVFCFGGAAGFLIGRHMPPLGGPGAFEPGFEGRGPRPLFAPGGRRGGPPAGFGRGRGGSPAPLPPDLMPRLTSELDLDAAQQTEIRKILDEHRDHLDRIHHEARDRFDKEQEELQNAVRGVLRPDQQEKFKRFLER
jgi:hypothetical protein